jgi:23S rRNA (cytosine1962-C5)-methyltransferase
MHPFIYARMVRAADPAARPGDIVNIHDKSGALFGRGLYNPNSTIVLRVLAHGDARIDDRFWRQKLASALALRRSLRLDDVTDAYRLVHAEGDGLSGLILERYADCLVFEVFSLGIFQRVDPLGRLASELLGRPASLDRPGRARVDWRIVVRADAAIERIEGFSAAASTTDVGPLTIREHGIRYRVDVAAGQKTGFFCDQRDNRRRFAVLCRDADVLDLCCYTGGFSLCAKVLGEAREVTAVDLDESAIAVAKENANLNQTRINFVHADAFTYLRQMIANGRQFDAVVLDPPKLALSRNDVEDALGKYHDLNSLAMQVVRPGGIFVTCSCSGLVSPETFLETVHRAGRRLHRPMQMLDQTSAAADHPVMLNCPESSYLKVLWFRLNAIHSRL